MLLAPAAALAAACGGRTDLFAHGAGVGPGDESVGDLELPAGVAPPVDGCSAPLPLPRGEAWLGDFALDEEGRPSPVEECELNRLVAKRFVVPGFFLDEDEVTNGCYRHCVVAGLCEPPPEFPEDRPWVPGPWTDPALQDHPVHTDFARVAVFCAWRGGRLPTWAELVRASHGDEPSPCKPDLLAAWIQCHWSSFESADCEALKRRAIGYEPVRSYPADVGPFGHYDLFGARQDTTSTRGPSGQEPHPVCALPDGAPDPKNLGSSEMRLGFTPAMVLINSPLAKGFLEEFPGFVTISNYILDVDEYPSEGRGFRCAYDPVR